MCLAYELSKNKADKIRDLARKRGYIRVWKVCMPDCTGWFYGNKWRPGIHEAENLHRRDGGWHAHLSKTAAKKVKNYWNRTCYNDHTIKVCYAKPSWIKSLGGDKKFGRIGIFTHLAFPDWDKGNMTIREFRALCRKES